MRNEALPNRIKIGQNITLSKCRSKIQTCISCGRLIKKGRIGICMTNKTDEMVLRKCLWMHLGCSDTFAENIRKAYIPFKEDIDTHNVIEGL